MPLNVAKMAHLSLSACNIGQLREQANELRGMATTARLDADIHALETLAARFDELAQAEALLSRRHAILPVLSAGR